MNIAAASTAVTYVDVVLPRSAGRRVPRRLTNRIRYAIPADAPLRSVIGSTTVDAPDLRTDRRVPIVIASPLRGSGWLNANGCCGDFTSPHRNAVLASNGSYLTFELFAVDWIRLVNGQFYTGDGKRNSDWPGYGAPLYAVADGTVVSTVNNKPEIPPFEDNPGLRTPEDYSGNDVIIRIGTGRYATYAHLQPGSVRVRRGQRVRTGQRIGLLGNSGNTTGPHLHFGIQSGPSFFSDSLPFEIDHYTLEGTAEPRPTPPRINVTGTPAPGTSVAPTDPLGDQARPGLAIGAVREHSAMRRPGRRYRPSGSSLPGFMIPAGSSAALTARRTSTPSGARLGAHPRRVVAPDRVVVRDRAAGGDDRVARRAPSPRCHWSSSASRVLARP